MDDYYAATHPDQEDLFDRPTERRGRARGVIVANLRRLVDELGTFAILDRTLDVLDSALGDGGRKEVAEAVRQLASREEILVEGPTTASRIYEARVSRGRTSRLF